MATAQAHVPPQNLEAEESVLGAMMVSEAAINPVIEEIRLKPDDFYREQHRKIFAAILQLQLAGDPVDALTVSEALSNNSELDAVGGRDLVSSLAATAPAPGNARHYAEIVQQNSMLRRLIAAAQTIQQSVDQRDGEAQHLAERAEKLLFDVAHAEHSSDFREIGTILEDELEKLEELSKGDAEVIGTPSGFRDLDSVTGGFRAGNLIVIAARPAMGKCLRGSTLIYDGATGSRRRLEDLVEAHERGEEIWVAAMGSDLKLRPAKISDAIRSGRQKLYALTTRLGRKVQATANHPLLTIDGWRPLEELHVGARIGVPRWLPRLQQPDSLPDHELVVLAALIADGNITGGTPRYSFGPESPVRDTVEDAVEACGARFSAGVERGDALLSNGNCAASNPITELCRRHGIWEKRSDNKFVPDAIFSLPDHQIVRFLSVLYACDGHVYVSDRLAQIGYSTISEQLARDVQHLLLRFGISSKIRTLKRDVYEGTGKVAREVRITEQRSLARFAMAIRIVGKEAGLSAILKRLAKSESMTNTDTAPVEVWERVLVAKGEKSWAEVSVAAGYGRTHNWHAGRRGISRDRLLQLSQVLESPELEQLGDSDVWWDEVASIDELGEEETYDLTVPLHHNFVADDVIVHNSAIVCNIAENAAMKYGKPVALFSLEMSEAELAQRFIASQSRIPSDKLRKGQVASRDWAGVVRACNNLDSAPMWIDDSSDLGMLELRAKSRRLHSQVMDKGGLGLIIVDYIQLMRAEDPRVNRVEQVAQMSRGLKILARELEVPVIAISQLSRAPEQRPDKRPILSDLRESGSIEQDADLVAFLYRDEYYTGEESEEPGVAELIVAKHRNGPVRKVKLAFVDRYPKFVDMARGEAPVEQRSGAEEPMLGGEGDSGTSTNGSGDSNGTGDDDGFDIAEEF